MNAFEDKVARGSLAAAWILIGGAAVLMAVSTRPLELPEQIAVFASAWNRESHREIVALAAPSDRGRIRAALANMRRDPANPSWPRLRDRDVQTAMLAARDAGFTSTSRFELEKATLVVGWCQDEHFEDWELLDFSLANR